MCQVLSGGPDYRNACEAVAQTTAQSQRDATNTTISQPPLVANGGYAIERGIEENDRLEQANLGDANLGDAKLIGAHLDGAHLEGAGLIGAKLTELQARLSSVPFSACQPAAASP